MYGENAKRFKWQEERERKSLNEQIVCTNWNQSLWLLKEQLKLWFTSVTVISFFLFSCFKKKEKLLLLTFSLMITNVRAWDVDLWWFVGLYVHNRRLDKLQFMVIKNIFPFHLITSKCSTVFTQMICDFSFSLVSAFLSATLKCQVATTTNFSHPKKTSSFWALQVELKKEKRNKSK